MPQIAIRETTFVKLSLRLIILPKKTNFYKIIFFLNFTG